MNNRNVQSIFQTSEFNDLNRDDFNNKYKNESNFRELKELKELHTQLMQDITFPLNNFDYRGNKVNGWSMNEKRGNKPYEPPVGWIGIGLKVLERYDCGCDNWIEKNSRDEWCVAYHGITGPNDVSKHIINQIITRGFKEGRGQVIQDDDDIFHPGQKVGTGIYFTPSIKTAEHYSTAINFGDEKYKTVLMVRVKPDKIRQSAKNDYFWVVNGNDDEVRPYRILFKKV
jgi:hypothetical protein